MEWLKKRFLGWSGLGAIVLIVLLTPAFLRQSFHRVPFDNGPAKALKEMQPDFIFLGNSLLQTRIDPDFLKQLLKNKKSYFFEIYGGGPHHWYAQLKNYVVASEVKPKAIFIFFADNKLTYKSIYRGHYKKMTESMLLDKEPVYDELTQLNYNSPLDRFRDWAEEFYPIQNYSDKALNFLRRIAVAPIFPDDMKFFVNRMLKAPFSREVLSFDEQKNYNKRMMVIEEINSTFDLKNLRSVATYGPETDKEAYDFQKWLPKSFLPHIMDLAKKNGLRLNFVRVKPRPNPDGTVTQSDEQKQYFVALKGYLESHGARFFDYFHEDEFTLPMYSDGDHLAWEYRQFSTQLFVNHFSEVLTQ